MPCLQNSLFRPSLNAAWLAFVRLWAFVALINTATQHLPAPTLSPTILVLLSSLTACVTIFLPSKVWLVCLLAALQIVLPHSGALPAGQDGQGVAQLYSGAIAGAGILLALVVVRLGPSPGSCLAAWSVLRPFMFWWLVIWLSLSALAKINYDYLRPEISVGSVYYQHLVTNPILSFLPSGPLGDWLGISLWLFLELAAAFLLVLRRTRIVGAACVWLIVLVSTLNPALSVADVPTLLLPSSLSVFTLRQLSVIVSRCRPPLLIMTAPHPVRKIASLLTCLLVPLAALLTAVLATPVLAGDSQFPYSLLTLAAKWLLVSLLLSGLAAVAGAWPHLRPARLPRLAKPMYLIVATLLTAELLPFLGVHILGQPSILRPSNVLLTHTSSNHILFGKIPAVGIFREVLVVTSENPLLPAGQHLPLALLRSHIHRHPEKQVTYQLTGLYQNQELRKSPPIPPPPPFIAKLVPLRPSPPAPPPNATTLPPLGVSHSRWNEHVAALPRHSSPPLLAPPRRMEKFAAVETSLNSLSSMTASFYTLDHSGYTGSSDGPSLLGEVENDPWTPASETASWVYHNPRGLVADHPRHHTPPLQLEMSGKSFRVWVKTQHGARPGFNAAVYYRYDAGTPEGRFGRAQNRSSVSTMVYSHSSSSDPTETWWVSPPLRRPTQAELFVYKIGVWKDQ